MEAHMDDKTRALNIMDINRRITELHAELEALHEMRDELIQRFGANK